MHIDWKIHWNQRFFSWISVVCFIPHWPWDALWRKNITGCKGGWRGRREAAHVPTLLPAFGTALCSDFQGTLVCVHILPRSLRTRFCPSVLPLGHMPVAPPARLCLWVRCHWTEGAHCWARCDFKGISLAFPFPLSRCFSCDSIIVGAVWLLHDILISWQVFQSKLSIWSPFITFDLGTRYQGPRHGVWQGPCLDFIELSSSGVFRAESHVGALFTLFVNVGCHYCCCLCIFSSQSPLHLWLGNLCHESSGKDRRTWLVGTIWRFTQ